jgi:hypothetical protein
MGARAKQAAKARRGKQPPSKQSGKVSSRKRHHFYPDSIPPGMAHEVFDVSRIDEDGLEVLDDEEVVAEPAPAPMTTRRRRSEAPHPPRPSARPRPLAPDDVHLERQLSYASNPTAILIDAPASHAPPSPRTPTRRVRTAVLMVGGAILALLVGAVFASRADHGATPGAAQHPASSDARR